MVEDCITRQEHEEFAKRIDAENNRQNNRISVLEDNVKKIGDLTLSIKDLTSEIKTMTNSISLQAKEIEKQGERIAKIENKPLDNLDKIKVAILSGIGGAIASGIVAAIIFLANNVH